MPIAAFRAAVLATRVVTGYAVDQLTDGMVLDTSKATALGLTAAEPERRPRP